MAANLSPEYQAAEKKFKSSTEPRDKLEALQDMLRAIPKHKGTEKMQADLKTRISKMRKECSKAGGASKTTGISIERSGDGQVVLIGPPNSGKSTLVDLLTHASPEVADYPYTTRLPTPGIMYHEDVPLQLVDLPPIADGYIESWLPQIIRVCDSAVLVLSFNNDDILSQYEELMGILEEYKLMLCGQELPDEEDIPRGFMPIPTVMIANKMDTPDARENLDIFREFFGTPFDTIEMNALDEESIKQLPAKMFDFMKLVRVYAKEPHKPAKMDKPFVFQRGDTLYDMAYSIHSDIANNLKVAKVWGAGKFDGQLINKDYVLDDKDVIEIHI